MEDIQSKPLGTEAERGSANRSRLYSILAEVYRYPEESFRRQAKQGEIVQAFEDLSTGLPYPLSLEQSERKGLTLPRL